MWKWLAIAVLLATPALAQWGLSTGDSGAPVVRPAPDHVAPPAPAPVCRPNVLAEPDRSCSSDADCTTVEQVVSCCGTRAIKGINRADLARFQAEDRRCNPGRHCGCAAGPSQLDDGSQQRDRRPVTVACRANRCTSALAAPPPPPPPHRWTSAEVAKFPRCEAKACGPAPLYPTATCPDGVSQSGRGPCVRVEGTCRWVRLVCP